MKSSDSIAALASALATAQADIVTVVKDRTNPHFKNTYATLDAIIASVRPPLSKQGLAILQGAATTLFDADGRPCALVVESRLLHKSGEWIENSVTVPLAKIDPQGAGSALTYGRRYSVSALLALATDDDDDAEGATERRDVSHAQTVSPAQMRSAATARPLTNTLACPKCSGPMFDNRAENAERKARGEKLRPEGKCKDQACGGVIWPAKEA